MCIIVKHEKKKRKRKCGIKISNKVGKTSYKWMICDDSKKLSKF